MPTIYQDSTTPRVAPGSASAASAQQTADYNRIFGTSAPAPVPKTTPAPVVTRTPGLLQTAQDEAASAAASRAAARREADSYAARMRQARIDAINTTFAPRIAREEKEGEARLSRVAALNLRSGIVGSGVDTTRTGEQKTENKAALQAIEDAKATAINEVFGWADEIARQRAEDIYKEKTEGANANVARYKEQADAALENIKILGAQGVDAESLKSVDPNTYNTLRDVSGMTDAQIDAYLKTNAPEGTYQWSAAQINGSKMMVPKVVNGKVTMESVDMGFTPNTGKEYKTAVKTDDGVLVIYGDGTYDVIGGSGSGVKLKPNAPSWEEYLDAAQRTAQQTFTNETRTELRKQYDREFILQDNSDYTSTEKKKLEQAGLLNSSRQEQLDFLYGQDSGGIDFSSAE